MEIYFEDKGDNADKVWNAIFEAGKASGIKPIGLEQGIHCVWKWAIVYMGMISTIPHLPGSRAGMDHQVQQGIHQQQLFWKTKADGLTKKLVGFEMLEKGIARHDYEIKDFEGKGDRAGYIRHPISFAGKGNWHGICWYKARRRGFGYIHQRTQYPAESESGEDAVCIIDNRIMNNG